MSRTEGDLLVEFLRDKEAERQQLLAEMPKVKDVKYRNAIAEQLGFLAELLDGAGTVNGTKGDKLVEYWEHCLEAGIEPDLDMRIEDLDG